MIIVKKETKSKIIVLFGIFWIFSGISLSIDNSNYLDQSDKILPDIKLSNTSLNIIATISIIEDVIKTIVGPIKTLTTLVAGQEDPHTYEPTPSEITALSNADVVFRMGITDLEPWWDNTAAAINSSGQWTPTIVMVKEDDMLKYDPLFFGGGGYNPHIWMDPNNIKNFTYKANNTLCNLDPSEKDTFSTNTQAYFNTLDELLTEINISQMSFQGLKVVVYHPSFFYLFELLKINRLALIEPGPEKEPSAKDIAKVIDIMNQKECKLIVYNPQIESNSVYEIARSTGSKLALLTPLLNIKVKWDGKETIISTYKEMIEYDLWALAHPKDPPSINWIIYIFITIAIAAIIISIVIYRKI